MSTSKPTPTYGPWSVVENADTCDGSNAASIYANTRYVADVYCGYVGSEGMPRDEQRANAAIIAEAGTVYHETGLTPRELLAQRDELLAAITMSADRAEWTINKSPAGSGVGLYRGALNSILSGLLAAIAKTKEPK